MTEGDGSPCSEPIIGFIFCAGVALESGEKPLSLQGSLSILEWAIRRVQSSFPPVANMSYVAFYRRDKWRAEYERIAERTAAKLLPTADGSRLAAGFAAARLDEAQTLVLIEGDAPFTDCEASSRLLRSHHDLRADVSQAWDAPAGLVPEVIASAALTRLDRLGLKLPSGIDYILFMRNLAAQSAEDGMNFSINRVHIGKLTEVPLYELPSRARIFDGRSATAARVVIERLAMQPDFAESTQGAYPAKLFKQLLLANSPKPADVSAVPNRDGRTRVLFASLANGFGGAEQALSTLVRHLNQGSFQPVLIAPGPSTLTRRLEASGCHVVVANRELASLTSGTLRFFAYALDAIQPDIVHVDSFAIAGLATVAATKSVPLIQHVRTFHRLAQPECFSLADKLIAVSRAVAEDLCRSDLPREKVEVVYDGVELPQVRNAAASAEIRSRFALQQDRFVILMPARLCRQKRQDLLLSSLAFLAREEQRNTSVFFVGSANIQELDYVEALRQIDRGRAGCDVRFLHFREDLPDLYSIADLVVICNSEEPLSLVALEAMAHSVPVVAPDSAGPAEIINHGQNGFLFQPNSPESLTRAVRLVRGLGEIPRSQLCANALHRVSETFRADTCARATERVYRALLNGAMVSREAAKDGH